MSGVFRLRQAKGTHPIGGTARRFDNTDKVTPSSICPVRWDNKTVVQNVAPAPEKVMPKTISKTTPPPQSYARTTGILGKIRGRQADKSSKSKS